MKGANMQTKMQTYIETAETSLLHTYNRYQIVIDRGEGTYIYDTDGKQYLDFVSGIAVFALGYHYKDYDTALKTQIDKIIHTSNYYYNVPTIEAARKLLSFSQMDRVFFTNSGAEAVEGALKAARKYAYHKDVCTDHEFIAMNNSFHGRTFGALSVTGNAHYREPFEPLIGPVRFGELNKIDTILPLINDKTCAIILETVQGEGGIHPVQPEFLQSIHEICQEKDILLILDEIQCGMGRCGYPFAWQKYGVRPDIMTCAKALGCGVPVGAFLLTEKVANASLGAGDHGTTYGGNPLAGAAVEKVLDLFASNHIIEHVQEITPYLEQQLDRLCTDYPFITERRGAGLMQGLQFDRPVAPLINLAMEKGLLLINAGADVLRLMPSLIIQKEHIDEMIRILRECLDQQPPRKQNP
jgi:acetylornithine/N-succinyldiaminopimelate aminotransferase